MTNPHLETERSRYDSYDATNGGLGGDNFTGEFGAEDFFNFFAETSSRHGFSGYGYEQPGTEPKPPPRKKGGKTEDGQVEFPITLEELYKGKVVKFTSHRNKLCIHCLGSVSTLYNLLPKAHANYIELVESPKQRPDLVPSAKAQVT